MSTQQFVQEVHPTKILTYDWSSYQQQVAPKPQTRTPNHLRTMIFAIVSALLILIAVAVFRTGDFVAFAAVGVVVSTLIGFMLGALKS